MRKVTFTAKQFNHFVFPPVGSAAAENDGEFETSIRLIRKFRDPALTQPSPMKPEEKRAYEAGLPIYPNSWLLEEQATFELEEDEYALLMKRMRAHRQHVLAVAAEDFQAAVEAVETAQTLTPTREKVKD